MFCQLNKLKEDFSIICELGLYFSALIDFAGHFSWGFARSSAVKERKPALGCIFTQILLTFVFRNSQHCKGLLWWLIAIYFNYSLAINDCCLLITTVSVAHVSPLPMNFTCLREELHLSGVWTLSSTIEMYILSPTTHNRTLYHTYREFIDTTQINRSSIHFWTSTWIDIEKNPWLLINNNNSKKDSFTMSHIQIRPIAVSSALEIVDFVNSDFAKVTKLKLW